MKPSIAGILIVSVGVVAVAGAAGMARAQAAGQPKGASTPSNWNYEIRDGKRVPKAQRKVNADGSWREEVRQGNCVTLKEKNAQGEVKTTRQCD